MIERIPSSKLRRRSLWLLSLPQRGLYSEPAPEVADARPVPLAGAAGRDPHLIEVVGDRRPRHRAARSSPGLEAIISGQGSAPESSLIQQAMESTLAQTSTPAPTQNNAPPPDVNTSESSTKWRPRGEYKDVTSERLGKQSLAHRNPAEAAAPLVTSPDLHLRYDARYAWPRSIQLLRQRHPLGRVHP